MGKSLIIAEKPSLAMSVVKAIGDMERKNGYFENKDYIVSFAYGHLLRLYDIDDYKKRKKTKWTLNELPFTPEKFKFKVTEDNGIKKQYKILGELINRDDVKEIINCGDPDREGQVIIDNIIYSYGCKKVIKRLWIEDQTSQTICRELSNLRDNKDFINIYKEGLCRTYMDWMLGINLSRLLSLKKNSYFPVGRVLIPIVKYIYDRDMEIKSFKSENFYVCISQNMKDGIKYTLELKEPTFNSEQIEKGNELVKKLNSSKAYVKEVVKKDITKKPGKLFSLSDAQVVISKRLKISFSESLAIIQKLYEEGYITYPRTSSQYLTQNEKSKVKEIISIFKELNYPVEFKDKDTIFNDEKVESHSALIPTSKIPSTLTGKDKDVYEIIRNRFLINFLNHDTVISNTEVKILVGTYEFKLSGNIIKEKGFYEYEPLNGKNSFLPQIEKGEEIEIKFELVERKTQPPKHISDEMLTRYLENPYKKQKNEYLENLSEGLEIGTQATRTGIIENAKKYGYIKQNKNTFTIDNNGIILIETLDLLKIDLYAYKTVEFSKILKEVNIGKQDLNSSILIIREEIEKIFNTSKDVVINKVIKEEKREIIGKCPRCGKNIYESKTSFYCEGFKDTPKCNFSIFKEDKFFKDKGKKVTKAIAKELIKKGKTKVKNLKKKNGKGTYEAVIKMIDSGKYVNFKLELN